MPKGDLKTLNVFSTRQFYSNLLYFLLEASDFILFLILFYYEHRVALPFLMPITSRTDESGTARQRRTKYVLPRASARFWDTYVAMASLKAHGSG